MGQWDFPMSKQGIQVNLVSEECTQQQSSREALNSQLLQLTNTIELQTTRDTKPFIFE